MAVRRILTMHPLEKPDVNFSGLAPDELSLYFTLTRRAEAPKVSPAERSPEAIEPLMVRVPAGAFTMGSTGEQIKQAIQNGLDKDLASAESPQHRLELPEYFIGKYPVTNLEYQAFIKDTRQTPPRNWNGEDYPENRGDYPVVSVTWHDAVAFCEWLAKKTGKIFRLPSEAEWEKAARGEKGLIYPWGDEFDPAKCNTSGSGPGTTTQVGQYSPGGDSPYGCADMVGNVWEWTRSKFEKYPYQADDGREDLSGDVHRVLRGGSFYHNRRNARCASRNGPYPGYRYHYLGFRVVVSPF
jgi:formylglycine-generating enzyme required for sulfatase activity